MKELLNQIASKAKDMWHIVGIELDIDDHELNAIVHANPVQCYLKVFELWKKKGTPPFTWTTILDALRSPAVGANDLARDVEAVVVMVVVVVVCHLLQALHLKRKFILTVIYLLINKF